MANKLNLFGWLEKVKSKRLYVVLVAVFIGAGVFLLFISDHQESSQPTTSQLSTTESYLNNLEERLNNVLSAIVGAGEVKCMITLDGEVERVVAYSNDEKKSSSSNTTTSGATNSSNTSTISKEPILITVNGKTEPLVLYEIMPAIKGIVVVASGADSVKVKLDILKAVQALLKVESSQVEIFTKQSL